MRPPVGIVFRLRRSLRFREIVKHAVPAVPQSVESKVGRGIAIANKPKDPSFRAEKSAWGRYIP